MAEETDILDGLNYDGTTFHILTSDTANSSNYLIQGDEELEGDQLNDSVLKRNASVEEQLGVTFKYTTTNYDWKEVTAAMEVVVMSGEDTYDLVIDDQLGLSTSSVNHQLYDVSDLKTIDFDEDCWWHEYMMNLSVDYKTINLIVGDYFMDVLNCSHALLVNRDLYRDLFDDPDTLYQMVTDGEWTYDTMLPLIKNTYYDLNGDGKKNANDRFGIIIGNIWGSCFPYVYGTDCDFVTRDSDGYPTLTLYSERLVKLYDYIREIYYSEGSNYNYDGEGTDDINSKFKSGEALFVDVTLRNFSVFRDDEIDIGIIPYPKLDESQESYVTVIHDTAEVGVLPMTVKDPEMSGAVITALCRKSHNTVMPEYYENSLKIKYSRDDASANMIDLIHDGITDEFCLVYGSDWANGIFTWTILEPLQKNLGSISSAYETRESAAIQALEDLVEAFKKQAE